MDSPKLTPIRYSQVFVFLILLPVILAACSKSPPAGLAEDAGTALGGSRDFAAGSGFGSASFYPLTVGNSWTYRGGGESRVLSGDGSPPWEDHGYAFTEIRRLVGTTYHEGTAYIVEEQVHHSIPESYFGPGTFWERVRQDAEGLFVLDTVLLEPPAMEGTRRLAATRPSGRSHVYRIDVTEWRADGANDPSLVRFADRVEKLRSLARGFVDRRGGPASPTGPEVRLLDYPLYIGANWSNRSDMPWPSRVSRIETLDTPAGRFPAYRIDIVPGGSPLEEGEWVRVWYSRAGYLGYSIHTFAEGTDQNGEPTGITYVLDDSMIVTSVQVSR